VLGYLYQWAESRGIDLERRLRSGTLTAGEIRDHSEYLRSGRTKIAGAIGHENVEGDAERVPILHPNTHASYMDVVKEFLIWAAQSYQPDGVDAEDVPEWIEQAEGQIRRQFDSLRNWTNSPPHEEGLTEDDVSELCKLIDPASPQNPFKAHLRLRNYCIVMLLLHTGLRRGELLKLRTDQMPKGPKRTITVSRDTANDAGDSRRDEPRVKTWGREVVVSMELARALALYERRDRPRKRIEPTAYLFLNDRGVPLNYSGIHEMFLRLREALPAIGRRLRAHALRHTCVSRWMRLCHERGLSDAETQLVLTYYFGWSPRSKMPPRYANAWIKDLTHKMLVAYQSKFE
jgi:integrase